MCTRRDGTRSKAHANTNRREACHALLVALSTLMLLLCEACELALCTVQPMGQEFSTPRHDFEATEVSLEVRRALYQLAAAPLKAHKICEFEWRMSCGSLSRCGDLWPLFRTYRKEQAPTAQRAS